MGRPTKLTKKLSDAICEAIRNGSTEQAAAALSGVDRRTFMRWKRRGEASDEEPFASFRLALTRAHEDYISELLGEIRHATKLTKEGPIEDWSSRAWILERRYPGRFGRRAMSEVQLRQRVEELLDAAKDEMSPEAWREFVSAAAVLQNLDPEELAASLGVDPDPGALPPTTH